MNLLPDSHNNPLCSQAFFFCHRHSFARHAILPIRGAVGQKRVTIP